MDNLTSKNNRELYDEDYYLTRVEGWQEFKAGKVHPKKKSIVDKSGVKGKIILDIGCGRGEFIKLSIQNGAKYCYGIDYSKASISIARKYLKGVENIKLITGSYKKITAIEDKIERCFMIDFIEHISFDEFKECLEEVKKIQAQDIIIIGSTPINIKRGDYKGMHISQHTTETIKQIGQPFYNRIDFSYDKGNLYFAMRDPK